MLRVLFALCFLLVGEARGQEMPYDDMNLRGLKSVGVHVNPLYQSEKDCGLKQDALQTVVQLPLNT